MSDPLNFPDLALRVGLRATPVLLAALLAAWACRHRPRLGSALLHACVVALLLLPVAAARTPHLCVPCLRGAAGNPEVAAVGSAPPEVPVSDPAATAAPEPPPGVDAAPPVGVGLAPAPSGSSESVPCASGEASAAETCPSAPALSVAPTAWGPGGWLLRVYLAGVALCLLRLASGLVAVARLRKASVPARETAWAERLAYWRERLGIRRAVALRWSERARVPLTVGWLRPVILLPRSWLEQDAGAHRDAVLLHELAHVLRADYAWQFLLCLVRAVYWPHPLGWLLEPVARQLRERACDDLCVHGMESAAGYRRALLEIALALQEHRERLPGLAMARSSRLGRRLAHIERSPGAPSCLACGPVRWALAAVAPGATILLGALELTPAAAGTVGSTPAPDSPPAAAAAEGATGLAGLQRGQISAYELRVAGGGDPARAPAGLVAILGESRLKHLSYVSHVAFSPDGKLLASVGGDSTLRLWDPNTGEERQHFAGRPMWENGPDHLSCVAFSPDGRTIAAGSGANAVFLWDLATGREVQLLKGDTPVTRVAFSPDGRLLATGHEVDAAVWEIAKGKRLHKLAAHREEFRREYTTDHVTVAFAADGQSLFVGHPDRTVRTWDVKTGKLLRTLPTGGPVLSLALSKDGKLLATGSREKEVGLWEADTGRSLHLLPGHEHYVQAVAFHPDGQLLASGGLDGQVKYWDIKTGKLQKQFAASRHVGVEALAFNPDGTTLASAGLAVRLWEAKTGLPRLRLSGHLGAVEAVAFSPDGRVLATGGADGTVKVWDPAARAVRRDLDLGSASVSAVAISPDGTALAALEWGKHRVHVWDLATGQRRFLDQAEGDLGQALTFSPDGRWLAAVALSRSEQGTVTLWEWRAGKLHGRINAARGSALFTADSKRLIVIGQTWGRVGFQGELTIWDLATLRREAQLLDPSGLSHVGGAALSPDGRTLALSGTVYQPDDSSKNAVLLWDVQKRQPRLALDLGDALPQYLDFAPDGRSLLTLGFKDAVARVWDPRDGKLRETMRLTDPGAFRVRATRFAPDSRHFAAALGNGTVYLLRIQPPADNVPEVTAPPPPVARAESAADLWKQLVGKPAPELRQAKGWVFGAPVRLADLRGQHVLLHFWNFQSEYEMARLMLLHEQFGDRGLAIVVVLPDFDGSVEGSREWLAREGQRNWGGRALPFRVVLDGGGEALIAGTRLKAPGATHAAYRIPYGQRGWRLHSTTLLVGPDGKLLRQIAGLPMPVKEAEALLGKKARVPAWQERMEQLYALTEGQVLRRIAPPWPQERTDYVFYRDAAYSVEEAHVFQYDGRLSLAGSSGGKKQTLADVLRSVVRLKAHDVAGPADLLGLEIPGDWVVRKGATPAQVLHALEGILRDELRHPLRLRRGDVEEEVLVAGGRYQPPADSPVVKENTVHFYAGDTHPAQGSPGTARSVQELLDDLGDVLRRRVLNETQGPAALNVRWMNHLGRGTEEMASGTPGGAEKLQGLFRNLAQQTGLQLRLERRKVAVWQVSRGN